MINKFEIELIIKNDQKIDKNTIKNNIVNNYDGDSFVIISDNDKKRIKIHYHTNKPQEVLKYVMTLGEIYKVSINNMQPSK